MLAALRAAPGALCPQERDYGYAPPMPVLKGRLLLAGERGDLATPAPSMPALRRLARGTPGRVVKVCEVVARGGR